jgi:hypothetical protein
MEISPKNNWTITHQARETPYRCDFCSKKFGDKSNLERHLEIWHDQEISKDRQASSSSSEEEEADRPAATEKPPNGAEGDRLVENKTENDASPQDIEGEQRVQKRSEDQEQTKSVTSGKKKSSKKRSANNWNKKRVRRNQNRNLNETVEDRTCQFCSKLFSIGSNRKRHEFICANNPNVTRDIQLAEDTPVVVEAAEVDNPSRGNSSKASTNDQAPNDDAEVYQDVESPPSKLKRACPYCAKVFTKKANCRKHEGSCRENPDIRKNAELIPVMADVSDESVEEAEVQPAKAISGKHKLRPCQYCSRQVCGSNIRRHERKCQENPENKGEAVESSAAEESEAEASDNSSKSKPCPYCAKSVLSNNLKRHVRSCKQNRDKNNSVLTQSEENEESAEEESKPEVEENLKVKSVSKRKKVRHCQYCSKPFENHLRRHEKRCSFASVVKKPLKKAQVPSSSHGKSKESDAGDSVSLPISRTVSKLKKSGPKSRQKRYQIIKLSKIPTFIFICSVKCF